MQRRSPAFFALIALGVILLLAGIVYGLGSRHVQYRSVGQGSIAHYLSADGTGYLQMEGNSALYIVHQDNFSPTLPTFADSDTISFVYDPGETTAIDESSTIGTHLVGTAAKGVAITAINTTGQKTYTTPEYARNAEGYDNNQWPIGIGLLVVGLLLLGGSFFLPKKKPAAQVAPIAPAYIPTQAQQQQPVYPQNTPPYGQPLQQGYPTVYPPPQQNYPPQQVPFQQPSSPNYPQQPAVPFGSSQQPQQVPFQQPSSPNYPQQPAIPFGSPQQPQPQAPFGQPQQQQRPTPQGGQFVRPKPVQPPQQ